MARVQRLGKQGPLLFLPTHRSHLDYLIMSDLCLARDMVAPHIAAGINLSFWPMGSIFRAAGAFFLRRSFHGDELYATLLSEYLSAVLREGHNVEIFIEGGRTPQRPGAAAQARAALGGRGPGRAARHAARAHHPGLHRL